MTSAKKNEKTCDNFSHQRSHQETKPLHQTLLQQPQPLATQSHQQRQQVPVASAPASSYLTHQYLIPPTSNLARAIMVGNPGSGGYHGHQQLEQQQKPKSNLSALLEGENSRNGAAPSTLLETEQQTNIPRGVDAVPPSVQQQSPPPLNLADASDSNDATSILNSNLSWTSSKHDEADFASGPPPPPPPPPHVLGRSAPTILGNARQTRRLSGYQMEAPPLDLCRCTCGSSPITKPTKVIFGRRSLSSKELAALMPSSGSPYVKMLEMKDELELKMTKRLRQKRDSIALQAISSTSPVSRMSTPISRFSKAGSTASEKSLTDKDISITASSSQENVSTKPSSSKNEERQRRRDAHNCAVVDELCDVVADLFVAESKLINPTMYGVSRNLDRDQVLLSVRNFVRALPTRYALGADTPSEVLLHMRLMSVARSDPGKCVVHTMNLENDKYWASERSSTGKSQVKLLTISCSDAHGLLEYITKLLGTGGSRVLDADVMLSSDRIVLDRFVVEMNGRLRLDKLAQLIEAFLKNAADNEKQHREHKDDCSFQDGLKGEHSVSGPLYFNPKYHSTANLLRRDIEKELQSAVPLTQMLASPNRSEQMLDTQFAELKRHFSVPVDLSNRPSSILAPRRMSNQSANIESTISPAERHEHEESSAAIDPIANDVAVNSGSSRSMRHKRPLVNRRAATDLDRIELEGDSLEADYVTVPCRDIVGPAAQDRVVSLIPFDELKLIETIGMGRVSTIYRTAWQSPFAVQMVALKVAMVNSETKDTSHVDELRREADIAARLQHPNVVDLVGVAADAECFCIAYDFCDGGSVLSLLSDTSRYYEYLPIALDVANGMAYLHSRDIIHRDLKPSNVLLTRDHRAKIADFGMSVANTGQELTAETGTYRFMAPEVIRHESYSSNADVYSFGVFLWQLITRQVPFGSMTPVQAAYAVAEGRRPEIPLSTPRRLREIIEACWDQDSHKRPSFTYIAMALADYAKLSFSPASVGAQTLQIANDMLATVEGNSNINVDFTATVPGPVQYGTNAPMYWNEESNDNIGLEI